MIRDILICACHSTEHQIIFSRDDEDIDKMIYCTIHLCPLPFFQRIKLAIKYIFGYRSKYGNFDEFLLTEQHVKQLKNIITYLESPK